MPTPACVVVLQPGTRDLEIQNLTLPDPTKHQVIVKMHASGICLSQLHDIHAERRFPKLMGHEGAGIITKTGPGVTHVKEGDAVLLTWLPRRAKTKDDVPIRTIIKVEDGEARPDSIFTWADHVLCDHNFVVKIDASVPTDVTSIVGCAVMTGAGAVLNTAGVKEGQSVAVYGAGGVGLSAIVGARMVKADPIIAIDIDDEKLEFAKKFGATHMINSTREDPVKAIHKITRDNDRFTIGGVNVSGADYVFDCIGIKPTIDQMLPSCRTNALTEDIGGMGVIVGVPMEEKLEFVNFQLHAYEKQVRGCLGGTCHPDRDFPLFLEWFDQGHLPLNQMVTRRYALDQVNEAVSDLEAGRIVGRAIIEF